MSSHRSTYLCTECDRFIAVVLHKGHTLWHRQQAEKKNRGFPTPYATERGHETHPKGKPATE